jgi:DNA-binding SARP family transcriptional activator
MARVSVRLLGGFQVRLESGAAIALPTRKAQALLAYLALPPGQAHPRDKLAALLWGSIREESARTSLRQALFAIRKGLGEAAVRTDGSTIALAAESVDVDAAALAHDVASGSPAALARAADLYRGDLLAGLVVDEGPWEEWLLGERERLRELALEGLAKLLAHQRRTGPLEPALQTALRLLTLDPLQESVHRVLMRLYADLGRRGAALRQYQHCVAVLQRELAAEPDPETKQLYQDILRRRPSSIPLERGRGPADSDYGPLVGRDAELSALRAALEEATRGSARMLALIGDAGIGKSRLVAALAADGRARGARVIFGRCFENERMQPFAPWIEGLRAARLTADDDALRALDPTWRVELSRLFPELASPEAPPPAEDRMRLFEAVARYLESLAAPDPLGLILEDVHWADDVSLALLAYVRRRLDTARMLIVVTARADELADATVVRRTLDELQHQGRLVSLSLAPLGRDDSLALVRALARAGTDSAGLQRLGDDIWRSSEGHPFMIVESLRALEQGAPGTERRPLSLPGRVRQVIEARLDRLSPSARELASVAAVIGRDVDFAVLHAAAGVGAGAAATALEELVRRRVLHGVGERFEFTHERIRDVAYEAMLAPRRMLVHRQVAAAMEGLATADGDSQALAAARHYREAHVWDKAVTLFREAAAHAMSRSGYQEAVACLDQALEALRHLPDARPTLEAGVDIRLELRTALYPLGALERTLTALREAQSLAEALGDTRRLGRIAAYLCVAYRRLGDLDRAIAEGERALAAAAVIDDLALHVTMRLYFGQALWFTGVLRRAVEVLAQNVTSLTPAQLRQRFGAPGYPAVFSMTDMASVLAELGEVAEAMRLAERGLALAEELAQPFTSIAVHIAVASVAITAGEFEKAIVGLETARVLCERGDFPVQRLAVMARLGYAYIFTGRLDEGLRLLETAAADIDRIDGFWRPRVLGWLAEGYLASARAEDAARVAARAQQLAADNMPANRAWTTWLAGEVASHGGHTERAAQHYRDAAAIADRLELWFLRARCHLSLARLYRAAGDPGAGAELVSARTAFRAMGSAYWLSIAEAEARQAQG